jgi:hypothetical protein
LFNLLQAPHHQFHFLFMFNKCCGQHFFMSNYYILHLLHHLGECVIYNCTVLLLQPSKSPLLPSPPLGFFPTYVESHGVLDPIVFKQTQGLHYSSLIPICGLQIQGDQYGAQRAFIHTILCPTNAPIPRKAIRFFSHRTTSHPSFS